MELISRNYSVCVFNVSSNVWFQVSNSHNTGTGSHSTTGCPPIVSRSEWHARAPAHHIGPLPAVPGNVYIHHGATHGCHTKADCIKLVQSYQNYHMDTHGNDKSIESLYSSYLIRYIYQRCLLNSSYKIYYMNARGKDENIFNCSMWNCCSIRKIIPINELDIFYMCDKQNTDECHFKGTILLHT